MPSPTRTTSMPQERLSPESLTSPESTTTTASHIRELECRERSSFSKLLNAMSCVICMVPASLAVVRGSCETCVYSLPIRVR